MRYVENSQKLNIGSDVNNDKVNLFIQIFIPPSQVRRNEINTCLKNNVKNPFISRIYLMNERIYTDQELGASSDKLIQVLTPRRMNYSDVFNYCDSIKIIGYIIIANADIFFNVTLENIFKSDIHLKPIMMAQLRYEYSHSPLKIKLYENLVGASQDAWIYHSNFNNRLANNAAFNFMLGMPGCDNHITYLFKLLNFKLINDPAAIMCFHYHSSNIRSYSKNDKIPAPYLLVSHYGNKKIPVDVNFYEDNIYLHDYIKSRLDQNKKFIVPRIQGWAENIICSGLYDKKNMTNIITNMKNNAGVSLTSWNSISRYKYNHLEAFRNCEMYAGWSTTGCDKCYLYMKPSHDFIEYTVCKNKTKLWAESVLDIYNFIKYDIVWTTALRGKRILIVSAFVETMKTKIPVLEKIYGRDLFPECSFIFIKPPQLSGDCESRDWEIEFNLFCVELDSLKETYDVALLSMGGLGNSCANYIFTNHGKSSIYIGGVLSMYFGIYSNRWIKEKSSILKMYMNEHWSRPASSEHYKGCNKIENGCYV